MELSQVLSRPIAEKNLLRRREGTLPRMKAFRPVQRHNPGS